jgi:hypothetical protein
VVVKDSEEVNKGTASATKKIGEDTEKAATSRVGGAVAGWEKETHLQGPGVWGGGGGMGWGTKGVFQVKLVIAMMVPLLEGKGEALVVKKFRVELVFGAGGDKDNLEVVGALAIARAGDAFCFAVGDGVDTEEEEVVREALLVVGQGGG